ncbi:hypothetical protein DID76_02640 [Candidatus Marinamargulisbacteria bacterium SCGC AG-414-C22]|nr:hypothetical protein DID76_02640 [Candidatus Marinamargulisbacteria bacterium SCGC AG-414-C22]
MRHVKDVAKQGPRVSFSGFKGFQVSSGSKQHSNGYSNSGFGARSVKMGGVFVGLLGAVALVNCSSDDQQNKVKKLTYDDIKARCNKGHVIVGVRDSKDTRHVLWYDVTHFPHPGPDLSMFNGKIISDMWDKQKGLQFHRTKMIVTEIRDEYFIGQTRATGCPEATMDDLLHIFPSEVQHILSKRDVFSVVPLNVDGSPDGREHFIRNHHVCDLELAKERQALIGLLKDTHGISSNKAEKLCIKTLQKASQCSEKVRDQLSSIEVTVCDEEISLYDCLQNKRAKVIHTLVSCGGHRRGDYVAKYGGRPEGSPWKNAVYEAQFTGVCIADLCSDLKDTDVISLSDKQGYHIYLTGEIAKKSFLCFGQDGHLLDVTHGFPFRIVVPGFVGAYQVKHVQDVTYSPHVKPVEALAKGNGKAYVSSRGNFTIPPNVAQVVFQQESNGAFLLKGNAFAGLGVATIAIQTNHGNWQTIYNRDLITKADFDPTNNVMIPFEYLLGPDITTVVLKVTAINGETQTTYPNYARQLYFSEPMQFEKNDASWQEVPFTVSLDVSNLNVS